ncbi:YdcF family protein [Sandaracinus amylolyticus]|uniref:YdcF family protein n=1 Tax=Sandaracinus amylolyticus TaxID=927083 RepID=UPI001F290589|nr:YdcF family protein [Sandaracinus amylolyticus]UJR82330.1 Hypothetical protein I5071_43950 [Sandaracinus amylolyticus]
MARRWSVILVGTTIAAWLAAAVAIDVRGSRAAPDGTYDAIVVLGCRVNQDGRASRVLARRARRAATLWLEGRAPIVVLTGGVGTHPPSEAHAAAAILREHGVPDDAMVLEERSTSTAENARFARALTDARRVLIVTDGFHATRAALVFAREFDDVAVSPVTAGPWVRSKGALREVPLLVRDYLRR